MKKVIHKLKFITVAALTLSLGACDAILDDEVTDYGATPVLVQFVNSAETANFVQGDDSPVYTYDIPVTLIGGRNQPINEAVTVNVAVDPSSTAVEGQEFNLLTESVTIPAGEMTAPVQIEVFSANLDPFDPKTVVLEIVSSDLTVSEASTTDIVLQAACEFDLAGFYGTYDAVESGEFEYEVVVSEGPVANSLLLSNLYETGGETVIVLNEDTTNPTVTFESQANDAVLYDHAVYGDVWATTLTATSATYGSCDYSMNLVFRRCVSIGCFAGSTPVVLTKQAAAPVATAAE